MNPEIQSLSSLVSPRFDLETSNDILSSNIAAPLQMEASGNLAEQLKPFASRPAALSTASKKELKPIQNRMDDYWEASIDRFNSQPIPFEIALNDNDPLSSTGLTWQDFDQNESGDAIYLYYGLNDINFESRSFKRQGDISQPELLQKRGHLAPAAWTDSNEAISLETLKQRALEYWGQTELNLPALVRDLSQGNGYFRPFLVFSRCRKEAAAWLEANQGDARLITFELPKRWVIENLLTGSETRLIQGHVNKNVFYTFYGLPQEFLIDIQAFNYSGALKPIADELPHWTPFPSLKPAIMASF